MYSVRQVASYMQPQMAAPWVCTWQWGEIKDFGMLQAIYLLHSEEYLWNIKSGILQAACRLRIPLRINYQFTHIRSTYHIIYPYSTYICNLRPVSMSVGTYILKGFRNEPNYQRRDKKFWNLTRRDGWGRDLEEDHHITIICTN